jgi:hypothetical protein
VVVSAKWPPIVRFMDGSLDQQQSLLHDQQILCGPLSDENNFEISSNVFQVCIAVAAFSIYMPNLAAIIAQIQARLTNLIKNSLDKQTQKE